MSRDVKSILRTLEMSLDMHLCQMAMLDKAGKRIMALENRVRELEGDKTSDSQEITQKG